MRNRLLVIILLSFQAIQSYSQSFIADCSKLCVTSVALNQGDPRYIDITIFNADTSSSHINYPYVSLLIATNGDTVAKGTLNHFIHGPNSSQTYTDTLLKPSLIGFIGTVHFTYSTLNGDSTCILDYPCQPSSVQKNELDQVVLVPNPCSGQFTIASITQNIQVSIYDLHGRKIILKEYESISTLIDVSSFSNGIYLLEIRNKQQLIYKKLVIQKS